MSAVPDIPLFEVRLAAVEDVEHTILSENGLARSFFDESEFGDFTSLDLDRAKQVTLPMIKTGELVCLLGCNRGIPVGFLMFNLARHYTADSMAHLFMFYVHRQRRLTPLGRALLEGAERIAEELGAKVFYAGATANIGNGVDQRLMNLLDKRGYLRLGGVSRKVLR